MLELNQTVLLLIDVQGKLAQSMADKDQLFANLRKLVAGVRVLRVPLLLTEQNPEKLGATIPELREVLGDAPALAKLTFSCLGDAGIVEALRATRRRQVLVAGIEAHVCVYQTTEDLLASGYEVHLVADAVSSRAALNRELAIRRLTADGARLTTTEMALMELQRVAGNDQFRELLKVVR